MNRPMGIRLEKSFLDKIEKISKEESLDRSTLIRRLVNIGYKETIKRKAAENYIKGKITLSEAARIAEISIFDMEKYLVEQGFKSQYSIKDLKEELKHLG